MKAATIIGPAARNGIACSQRRLTISGDGTGK